MVVLTRKEKRALLLLIGCFALGTLFYYWQEGEFASGKEYSVKINSPQKATQVSNQNRKININEASQSELESLPGVGPRTAERILAHREAKGRFYKIEDLLEVKGIGEKKLQKISKYIDVR